MSDLGFAEMQQLQRELQEKYKDKWMPIEPATAKTKLLWLVAELGEVIDIVKKEGDEAIMSDAAVRTHFTEELCDVLMYLNDVMLCCDISVEELKEIYRAKHRKNMERW